ncbi:MAG: hypothetical protein RIB98_00030 [Acidimicrobiales bacterium]
MTRIAIIGGGRAATLHAEAALAAPGVELVGVGGRPGTAGALAAATGVPDLAVDDLAARADGLVIAVSSDQAATVIGRLGPDMPLLVESPVLFGPECPVSPLAVTAVNLLHAATVKRGLRAIADLGAVHHLVLRGRAVRRAHMNDVATDPFAGAWPVLLAAAGTPATTVEATVAAHHLTATLGLTDGRRVRAELEWVDADSAASALTELEAAGETGVVTIGLWPTPTLDIDGRQVVGDNRDESPLVCLGFVEQMRRFAGVCDGRSAPWPPLGVGQGVAALARAAHRSAATGGAVEVS